MTSNAVEVPGRTHPFAARRRRRRALQGCTGCGGCIAACGLRLFILEARIGPDIGPAGLAPSGVEQGHRRLVGVQHSRAKHEALVRVIQPKSDPADPESTDVLQHHSPESQDNCMSPPTLQWDERLYHRDQLRAGRYAALADAEGFHEICFALEALGLRLYGEKENLGG